MTDDNGVMHDVIKLIEMEIEELIDSGPAANWPEMDRNIWIFIHDGNLNDGYDGKAWGDRIIKGLTVLNQVEGSSAQKVPPGGGEKT